MKILTLIFSASAIAAALIGCTTEPGPSKEVKPGVEGTAKFVTLDAGAHGTVVCSGIQEARTSDGRMKVTANLRNIQNRRVEVQANCVFMDAQGFSIDETPYRTVILDENATESVAFESFRKDVEKYTVRVRESR